MTAPRTFIASILIGLFTWSSVASATTWYVDDSATGLNNGSSWTDAFVELQAALSVAVAGDHIHVGQGTYTPDYDVNAGAHTGDRSASFILIGDITVQGGYAGVGTPDPDARDIETYQTILSGDLAGNDVPNFINNEENSYRILHAANLTIMSELAGVTITGGYADGETPLNQGGGLYCNSSELTLTDVTFRHNSSYDGAGLYAHASNLQAVRCQFIGNQATHLGSGAYLNEGT